MCAGAFRGQKVTLKPLEQEFQAVVRLHTSAEPNSIPLPLLYELQEELSIASPSLLPCNRILCLRGQLITHFGTLTLSVERIYTL